MNLSKSACSEPSETKRRRPRANVVRKPLEKEIQFPCNAYRQAPTCGTDRKKSKRDKEDAYSVCGGGVKLQKV
jgi:hypothetical protein